jgi:hypothetical protein
VTCQLTARSTWRCAKLRVLAEGLARQRENVVIATATAYASSRGHAIAAAAAAAMRRRRVLAQHRLSASACSRDRADFLPAMHQEPGHAAVLDDAVRAFRSICPPPVGFLAFRALAQNAFDAFSVYDPRGGVLAVTPLQPEPSSYPPAPSIGRSIGRCYFARLSTRKMYSPSVTSCPGNFLASAKRPPCADFECIAVGLVDVQRRVAPQLLALRVPSVNAKSICLGWVVGS